MTTVLAMQAPPQVRTPVGDSRLPHLLPTLSRGGRRADAFRYCCRARGPEPGRRKATLQSTPVLRLLASSDENFVAVRKTVGNQELASSAETSPRSWRGVDSMVFQGG